MGRLTTHVLDAAHGCPGSELKIELYRVEGAQMELLNSVVTNHDGRCDAPVLQGDDYRSGVYQLHFHAGDYYRARGVNLRVLSPYTLRAFFARDLSGFKRWSRSGRDAQSHAREALRHMPIAGMARSYMVLTALL